VHAELGDRVSLRRELPAAQVETASPVCGSIEEAARSLSDGRRELAAGVAGWARLASSGTHPFAAPEGVLRDDPKYDALKAAFPWALPRQLVFGLHSGEPQPARARVLALIERVAPAAERLGGAEALDHARALAARNGAERQRALAVERGPHGVVEWLADAFLP
jgi:gamma-glutamyl:cysteine ligase YbdK (ATP-grasp superfamily)